jgi:hypothetical protein
MGINLKRCVSCQQSSQRLQNESNRSHPSNRCSGNCRPKGMIIIPNYVLILIIPFHSRPNCTIAICSNNLSVKSKLSSIPESSADKRPPHTPSLIKLSSRFTATAKGGTAVVPSFPKTTSSPQATVVMGKSVIVHFSSRYTLLSELLRLMSLLEPTNPSKLKTLK